MVHAGAVEVIGLWRYPVKSLQGERLEAADLEPDGILGDRRWGIRDERTGRILTARRRPELLAASSSYEGQAPMITLPDGRVLTGPGAETDQALSDWLEGPVSLVSSSSEGPGRAEYFADATDDASAAIEWTMPEDRYVDAAAVLMLTTASLRTAAALHPDGTWDPRRFRPNILIDHSGEGWVEDAWIGRAVEVGSGRVVPTEPCMRCTMVTRVQPGLEADVDIFRTLARNHGGQFGVWCDVGAPGRIELGDRISVPDL